MEETLIRNEINFQAALGISAVGLNLYVIAVQAVGAKAVAEQGFRTI